MSYARCFRYWLEIMLCSNSDALSVDCGHDILRTGEWGEIYSGTGILLLIPIFTIQIKP